MVEETDTSDSAVEHQLSREYTDVCEKVEDLRYSGRLRDDEELEMEGDAGGRPDSGTR